MDPTADWRALLSEEADVDEVEELFEFLEMAEGALVGASLSPFSDDAFRALLISEDRSVRERLLAPIVPAQQRGTAAPARGTSLNGLGLVRSGTLLAAAGFDDDPGPVLERWLPAALAEAVELPPGERTSYALACAAHGYDDAVLALVDEPPLAFAPGASFGPDARSYARYIVAAAAEGASVDEIKTAWTSFVAFCPARLETEGLRWTDLLFAGYAAYTGIAGFEPGEVLDCIHEFVRELAAA